MNQFTSSDTLPATIGIVLGILLFKILAWAYEKFTGDNE